MKQLGTRPLLSSSFTAPSWVKPMTLGISIISGPLLTTRLMVPPLFQQLPCRGLLPDDLALGHGVTVFQRDIEEIIAHIAAVVPHLSVIIQPHEIGHQIGGLGDAGLLRHALGRGDGRSPLFRQVGTHKAPDREQSEHGQQDQDGRQQVAQAEQVGVIPGVFLPPGRSQASWCGPAPGCTPERTGP